MRALVVGASGYVGSALVPALVRSGASVVAAGRTGAKLAAAAWAGDVRLATLDVLDPRSARKVLRGCGRLDVAYYLVHSLGDDDYEALDERAARTFAAAAAEAGVRRIVYLGGLVPDSSQKISKHLRSRDQVGTILTQGPVGTVRLQAAAVIGAGSTPFELTRHLVNRLPVVPLPPFMSRPMQPIAIADVLHYLVASADPAVLPPGRYDITGERITTYAGMVRTYAEVAGLRRVFVPVPYLPPAGAAIVIGPMTPLGAELVAHLMPSLANTMISTDQRIRQFIPDPLGGLMDLREAMTRALRDPSPGQAPQPGSAKVSRLPRIGGLG
jgi:uncharacterized protein YbjT (DUF2867 family)